MSKNLELWREYEPRTFDELLGQEKAAQKIRRFLASGRGGALSFVGPSGVGKTTAARLVAREMGIDPDTSFHLTVSEGGSITLV